MTPLFRGRIKVTSTIALHSMLNISETVRDRGLVLKDVTWAWKVKLVTPVRLERNISKTTGDRDSVPKNYQ